MRAFAQGRGISDQLADPFALKKERDFERSLGEEVEIRLYKAQNKQKEFTGILKAYDKETVTIETAEGELVFERPDIALIRLAFDF